MTRLLRSGLTCAGCIVLLTLGTGLTALADVDAPTQNPTTGHHGADTGVNCNTSTAPVTPGHASSANGSPFNPNVTKFYAGNPNSASLAHANSTAAVSQYDTACLRQSTNHQ